MTSTLDPHSIDLRTLLRQYLKNLPIILAHHLQVSAVKTRSAVLHGIDAVILGLYHAHDIPKSSSTITQALTKPLELDSFAKLNAQAITHDFFHSHEDDTLKTLSQLSHLSIADSAVVLGYIIALSKDYIATLISHAKLQDNEYRSWLGLQSSFVSDLPANWLLTPIPKTTQTHSNYHSKLGKQATEMFDDSNVKIPNHRWLIQLAILTTKQNQALPNALTLGKKSHNNTIKIKKPKHPAIIAIKKYKFGLMALALVLVLVSVFIIWSMNKPEPPKPTEKSSEPIPQDVAIVRINETNDNQDNTNKPNHQQSSNHNKSNNQK